MIRVIDKALDILEMIAADPEKIWPLGSLADPLKMNHGTCANILKSLVARHYIEKMPAKKGYRLGRMAYQLAGKKDYKNELVTIARGEMTQLTREFNENTLLSVLQGNQRVAILRINCDHQIQVITPVEKNAYDSSTGRLLIAMQSDEDLELFISRNGLPRARTGNRMISKTAFLEEVRKIRKDGFAAWLPDDQILGLAFPIYQHHRVVASISLYAPGFRCTEKKRATMRKALSKAAQTITDRISNL